MTLKPSAQGSLAKTPFAHLLLYTYGRQLTGTLAVWPDSDQERSLGQDRVLFQGGTIVAVRPLAAADNSYAALIRLFKRRDAAYGFYEGQNLLGSAPGVFTDRVDTYRLLARGTREQPREDLMDGVLSRLGGRALRMRAGVPVDRLEFGAKERALIDLLRAAPATPEELLRSTELPPLEAKRVLYLLALIRGIEAADGLSSPPREETGPVQRMPVDQTGPVRKTTDPRMQRITLSDSHPELDAQRPLMSSRPSPRPSASQSGPAPTVSSITLPPMPADLSPEDAARWSELARLASRLDELTHYDLLGVAQTATPSEISAAYFGLVKKFHPDRLPASLKPLSAAAQQLFEQITEANEVLTNAEKRAEYQKAVAAGGGTRAAERLMRNVLESALEFQKAEVLTKRRAYAEAMELIQSALSKNPNEADYHAHYAWLLHLMNPTEPAPTAEMLRALDQALALHPRNERAHYYKGVVLKRLRREEQALKHFRAAAEINPRNVDAAREVRLAAMRKDSKAPPAPASGSVRIFSRLFGSKSDD